MAGMIQTQADKSPEAIAAFLDLLDNIPRSEERLAVSKDSMLSLYRTGKVGFRELFGTVRDWERKGLKPDPRKEWFGKIQDGRPRHGPRVPRGIPQEQAEADLDCR
jgi:hypothetical protein